MKVENMTSKLSGREVANQFIIYDDEGRTFFQSYNSIIVEVSRTGGITLDERYWNYSRTTSRYRSEFLGEGTPETRRKIENGTYLLADLN